MIEGLENLPGRYASVEPFTYVGVHSGGELRGVRVGLISHSREGNDRIEALLKGTDYILVNDPATGEQYEAQAERGWSSSHQEGRPTKTYFFTLQEIDRPMSFSELQINGHTFTVLRSGQTEKDGYVAIEVLLKLNPNEFTELLFLLGSDPVQVLRVGVDSEPAEKRFGGLVLWSRHEDDSETYYKQTITLREPTEPTGRRIIASAQEHEAVARMVVELTARHEALVDMLHVNGSISQEQASELKQEQWRGLVGDQRAREIWVQKYEVDDAEGDYESFRKVESRP